MGMERLSRFPEESFADIPANHITGTLSPLPEAVSSGSRRPSKRSRLTGTSLMASNEGPGPAEAKGGGGGARRRCAQCASEKTPQWRAGPLGPRTLCNACGVRYRSGRLEPDYRPAASRTLLLTQHSNSPRKAALSGSWSRNKRSRLPRNCRATPSHIHSPKIEGAEPAEAEGGGGAWGRCTHCTSEKMLQWRPGPLEPKMLCSACGVRYKSGQPVPEYTPAASPTFLPTQHSTSRRRAALSGRQPGTQRSRPPETSLATPSEGAGLAEAKGGGGRARRRCTHCASEKTPQWREGPLGPKTLCNACGLRYKSRQLVPEYRPAASPTFVSTQHSNSHRKVMELRRQKKARRQQNHHQGGEGGGGQAYRSPRDLEVG